MDKRVKIDKRIRMDKKVMKRIYFKSRKKEIQVYIYK